MSSQGVDHLVDDAVPGKPGIIDDDVNLAVAEIRSALDKLGDVCWAQDVADDGEGAAGFGGVDCVGDGVGFFYCWGSWLDLGFWILWAWGSCTGVYVGDYDFCAFVCE